MTHVVRRAPVDKRFDERGISLVEMAMVLLLLGIILPVVFGLVIAVQRETNFVESRSAAGDAAIPMTETISRQLHAATVLSSTTAAFTTASGANVIEFYANLGNAQGPTEVEIMSQACTSCGPGVYSLVEKMAPPTAYTFGGALTLGTGVVPPSASPASDCPGGGTFTPGIFEYLDSSGNCLPLTSGGLITAELGEVDTVVIHLTTLDSLKAKSSPTAEYYMRVSLPNVDFYNQSSQSGSASTTTSSTTTTTTSSTTTTTVAPTTTTVARSTTTTTVAHSTTTTTTCRYFGCS